ncbi:MAG TPA: amidohydrolase family protein [Gemmatimonadales bacterium]|nr:amidohydrolase family protein [Gemmatimonadales bacterium]
MTSRPAITFAATLLLTLPGCGQQGTGGNARDAAASVAITHVTVIDGTGAAPRSDQTVILIGDKIGAIGPSAELKPPKKARVIDGTGKYLLPGFWDLHVHLHFGTPDVLPVFVAHGITGIRELDTPMPDIDSIRARARSGSLLTPRIIAAGMMIEAAEVKPALAQADPVVRDFAMADRVFVANAEEARAAVRELAALKPDVLKHHNPFKREVFFAVLDEAKKSGLRVAGHFPMGEKVTLREVAEAGQASIEHLGWPGVSADFKAMSPAGQDSLVAIVKSSGLAFVPTFVVGNFAAETAPGADSTRFVQSHQDSRARFVTPQMWEMWDGMLKVMTATRKSGMLSRMDFPGEIAMLRRFHKAGVPILPGTDFTVQFLFPGSSAQEEVAELVRQVGMTPHEAIQAASRRSAELVGLGAETGTIERGKSADLFLVDADPLADITNTQRVVGVARGGRFFDRAELDSLLADAATRLQRTAKP